MDSIIYSRLLLVLSKKLDFLMCTRLVPILTCISHVYPIGKPAINQIYLLTILCDNFHYIVIQPCMLGLVQAITQRNTIIVPNTRMNEYTLLHTTEFRSMATYWVKVSRRLMNHIRLTCKVAIVNLVNY